MGAGRTASLLSESGFTGLEWIFGMAGDVLCADVLIQMAAEKTLLDRRRVWRDAIGISVFLRMVGRTRQISLLQIAGQT